MYINVHTTFRGIIYSGSQVIAYTRCRLRTSDNCIQDECQHELRDKSQSSIHEYAYNPSKETILHNLGMVQKDVISDRNWRWFRPLTVIPSVMPRTDVWQLYTGWMPTWTKRQIPVIKTWICIITHSKETILHNLGKVQKDVISDGNWRRFRPIIRHTIRNASHTDKMSEF